MTIYDVHFYGLFKYNPGGRIEIKMFRSPANIACKMSISDLKFKASVLREYEGKKDILKLIFEDGSCEYETLYEPGYYYEEGRWQETKWRKPQEAFIELFNDMNRKTQENNIINNNSTN